MPDREKIESGVHHCGELHICKGCPYRGYENCTTQLFGDLMAYIRKLEEKRLETGRKLKERGLAE